MSEAGAGGLYVGYREWSENVRASDRAQAAIREELAAQRSAIAHIPEEMQRLRTDNAEWRTEVMARLDKIASALEARPSQNDATALALHRVMDRLEQTAKPQPIEQQLEIVDRIADRIARAGRGGNNIVQTVGMIALAFGLYGFARAMGWVG